MRQFTLADVFLINHHCNFILPYFHVDEGETLKTTTSVAWIKYISVDT